MQVTIYPVSGSVQNLTSTGNTVGEITSQLQQKGLLNPSNTQWTVVTPDADGGDRFKLHNAKDNTVIPDGSRLIASATKVDHGC